MSGLRRALLGSKQGAAKWELAEVRVREGGEGGEGC
jgi:hypothetical protein